MPSISALTIYVFAFSTFIFGIITLLSPEIYLIMFDLPVSARPAAQGNSLAAIAMSIFYTLAAYQKNRAFFALSVPTRLLTTAVFWSDGEPWRRVALWEAGGALVTGLALVVEGL